MDTLRLVLPALRGAVETMHVHAERIEAAAPRGFSLATDAAEYLVRQGVPFREAHEAVGRLVALCDRQESSLGDVSAEQMLSISPVLTPDVRGCPHGQRRARGAVPVRRHRPGAGAGAAAGRTTRHRVWKGMGHRVGVVLTPIPRQFYDRAVLDVARDLLGAVLESSQGGELVRIRLTEVEAYGGIGRPASHAFRGPSPPTGPCSGRPGTPTCTSPTACTSA